MSNAGQTNQAWDWVGRYIAVIGVSLILASAIGSMDLFAKTFVIEGKLSAAHLVRFLGYSAALAALWMLGQRATMALQQHGGRWSFMQHLILPVVSLVVISATNSVALLVLKPLMNASMNNIYNWFFIFAILGGAVWVVLAVLGQSASLTEAFTSAAEKINASNKARACVSCGTACDADARFCPQCGKELPVTA